MKRKTLLLSTAVLLLVMQQLAAQQHGLRVKLSKSLTVT